MMNAVEIREYTKLLRECEDLRHENVNLRIELRDIKADIARYELNKMLSKEPEGKDDES